MNILQIKNIVQQVADVDFKIDKSNLKCYLNDENIINLNEIYFSSLKENFWQKLNSQMKSNVSTDLLVDINEDTRSNEKNLRIHLHRYRLKLTYLTNEDLALKDIYQNVCILIMSKIKVLTGISKELKLIIQNYDYRIESDFGNLEFGGEFKEVIVDILETEVVTELIVSENPYPRIFIDYYAFKFFTKLKEHMCSDSQNIFSDYSFIYRQLQMDKEIYPDISERTFREFLSDNYDISLDKLKTLESTSASNRPKIYELIRLGQNRPQI